MSKTNMLIVKKSPTVTILNKPKNLIQNHVTYRQGLKQEDAQKLYTFCSSEQKQTNQTEQETNDLAKDRKASFNNSKSRVYRPLAKSKGKTVSQVNIHKDRKKQANSSTISSNTLALNNSSIIEKKKTDKIITKDTKKQDKMINISINLNRNYINQLQDKQNKKEAYNNQQSNSNLKPFNKEKTIIMSQQELSRFTKKQAVEKMELQKTISKLQQDLKDMQQKQIQWNNFKKDSEDYIKYLLKQKQEIITQYQSLQQSLTSLENDKEYYLIAKQQYQNTIHQQQACIQQLKKEVDESRRLRHQVQILQNKIKQLDTANNETSTPLQLLEIQNYHLKKQLEINQRHQNIRTSSIIENQDLRKMVKDLSSTKEILLAEIKQMYVFKLKCEVFERSLEQSNNKMTKLVQQNHNLKLIARRDRNSQERSQGHSEFQFRLDTSPHSLSQVQVVWKRQQSRKNMGQSNIREYFDHDFFSGFSKQKL